MTNKNRNKIQGIHFDDYRKFKQKKYHKISAGKNNKKLHSSELLEYHQHDGKHYDRSNKKYIK